jgi:hypothetical protein
LWAHTNSTLFDTICCSKKLSRDKAAIKENVGLLIPFCILKIIKLSGLMSSLQASLSTVTTICYLSSKDIE